MIEQHDELRAHIRQIKHAVATTTCRKTVDALRQMLRETEAKLRATEPRSPDGYMIGRDDLLEMGHRGRVNTL